jgi:hypothetical protein
VIEIFGGFVALFGPPMVRATARVFGRGHL